MENIRSLAGRRALDHFCRSRVLVALDFDGTLAPIVPDPPRAGLPPSTRALLRKVARYYPCAVISGRARSDVGRRLRGIGLHAIVGNHGLEPLANRAVHSPLVRSWRRQLEETVSQLDGVVVEDKGLTLAIHYRQSPAKAAARLAIVAATTKLGKVRAVGGKHVVNLIPTGTGDKGAALRRACRRAGCDAAIFVGDDETDEDVFGLDWPGSLLSIRVGRSRCSRATYFLRRRSDIDWLLRELILARCRAPEPVVP